MLVKFFEEFVAARDEISECLSGSATGWASGVTVGQPIEYSTQAAWGNQKISPFRYQTQKEKRPPNARGDLFSTLSAAQCERETSSQVLTDLPQERPDERALRQAHLVFKCYEKAEIS